MNKTILRGLTALLFMLAALWSFAPAAPDRFQLFTYTPAPTPSPIPTPEPTSIPSPSPEPAQIYESKSGNGHRVILDDAADLLTPEEEAQVLEVMQQLSAYCSVVFRTTNEHYTDTLLSVQQYVDRNISTSLDVPSVAFCINMSDRMIDLLTRGSMRTHVDSSEANAITDRNSSLATQKKYGACAAAVFRDVYNAVHGIYAFSAMRTICGVLLGLGIALLAAFTVTLKKSLQPDTDVTTLSLNRECSSNVKMISKELIATQKEPGVRRVVSSRSSCSSCSSGSSCSSQSSCGSGGGSSF